MTLPAQRATGSAVRHTDTRPSGTFWVPFSAGHGTCSPHVLGESSTTEFVPSLSLSLGTGSCRVAQAGLELGGSSHPPASASQCRGCGAPQHPPPQFSTPLINWFHSLTPKRQTSRVSGLQGEAGDSWARGGQGESSGFSSRPTSGQWSLLCGHLVSGKEEKPKGPQGHFQEGGLVTAGLQTELGPGCP